jgi:hypothetical protein
LLNGQSNPFTAEIATILEVLWRRCRDVVAELLT